MSKKKTRESMSRNEPHIRENIDNKGRAVTGTMDKNPQGWSESDQKKAAERKTASASKASGTAKTTRSTTAKTGKTTKASTTKSPSHKHEGMDDMGVEIFDFTIDFIDLNEDYNEDFELDSEYESSSNRNRCF